MSDDRLAALDRENEPSIEEQLVAILARHKVDPVAVWPEIVELVRNQANRMRDLQAALSSTAKPAPCPECGGERWYSAHGRNGEQVQEQCQACYGQAQPAPVQGVVVPVSPEVWAVVFPALFKFAHEKAAEWNEFSKSLNLCRLPAAAWREFATALFRVDGGND